MGDEVQAGSVLLPASRRGRYLANIVRRQAVDGTGIKFNKDADRMNAEAKKKVDVLSEELLPYIIAEQERRTTLYKRVMTAIQNGEKGVTIAEIRNKPPAIIRKGLMYRCPTNRAPREPDGSGVIMCEDNQKPKEIIFESCLSAEDKELFVAENKYFFCNRHKVESPDLPRNGTTVIGCAPCERTPLNYTSQKCALEDTDDVVVHYRYYPDRTYKFVSELDPEREVCDHWNPCQIGYIFSLPGPDQASPASELWQDNNNETAIAGQSYTTSVYRLRIPDGNLYDGIGKYNSNGLRSRVSQAYEKSFQENLRVFHWIVGEYVKIQLIFTPLRTTDVTTYYVRFENAAQKGQFHFVALLTISLGQTQLNPAQVVAMPAQQLNATSVTYACEQCALRGIMLRAADGSVRNLDHDKYRLHKERDEKTVIEFKFGTATAREFGDYFLIMQNDDGSEERLKALSFKVISVERIRSAAAVGSTVDVSTTYGCDSLRADCELQDVLCRGVSALASGGVDHIPTYKRLHINIASFEDHNACVYVAIFKVGDDYYRQNVAILEKVELEGAKPLRVDPPAEGAHYEHTIKYKCHRLDCSLTNVTVNGFPLETTTRRSSVGSVAYFLPGMNSVTIGITEYSALYEGVYQGEFVVGGQHITKTLMEIGAEVADDTTTETTETAETTDTTETTEPESDVDTTGPDSETEPITEPEVKPDPEVAKDPDVAKDTDVAKDPDAAQDPDVAKDSDVAKDPDAAENPDAAKDPDAAEDPDAAKADEPSLRKHLSPSKSHRSAAGAIYDAAKYSVPGIIHIQAVEVVALRGAAASGGAYHGAVRAAPAATLAAVRCRGDNVTAGWRQADNDTLNVDFDHFNDSNACVYMGIFKIGQTEHRKTLAVLEMIKVTAGAVVAPPVGGALNHTAVYTCNITKCDPQMIYINDRTLKSDDKERFYSYKSEMVKGPDGDVMTVTLNFSIAPFTKDFEGVYQVVVSNGAETITKNIMEVGALV